MSDTPRPAPPTVRPVLLLHGWPYDIHSFVDVAPLLASAGYRVIVPYLRGYGTTRFLSARHVRNGQPSALAVDAIALMDALKIEKATLAGFDWGARTANIVAALWPERCKAMVSVSGYLIGSQEAGKMPLPPKAELEWWYQFYFATERGRAGYEKYRRDFSKLIWQLASPKWNFDDATFDRSAAAFDNPDHVDIVIHNYRWRLGLAEGEPKYDDLEKRLAAGPVITVPTITLEGDANGAPHPEPAAYAKKFSGKYEHRIITGGIGHNLPQEAPQAFAQAVVDVAEADRRQRVPVAPASNATNQEEHDQSECTDDTSPEKSCTRPRPTPPAAGKTALSRSSDGHLDVKLSTPGSARIGTNPEQLFAAGWSACFESAIGLAARKRKIALPADPAIDAEVDLTSRTAATPSARGSTSACRVSTRDVAQPWSTKHTRSVRTRKRRAATSTLRSTWSERLRRGESRGPCTLKAACGCACALQHVLTQRLLDRKETTSWPSPSKSTGTTHDVDVDGDTPLLWVLRDVLGMTGTKFGCGMALCGACTVHIDGAPPAPASRSIDSVGTSEITTIEAIGATAAGAKIQKAWLDREVAAVRLLPVRPDHVGRGAARQQPAPDRRRHRRRHVRQHLPLRDLCAHPRRHQAGRAANGQGGRP